MAANETRTLEKCGQNSDIDLIAVTFSHAKHADLERDIRMKVRNETSGKE